MKLAVEGFPSLSKVRLLEGFFKTSQDLGEKYILSLDVDRFLAPCYEAHGLKPKKKRYSGWEARAISGHSLGHFMSALAVTYQATGNEELKKILDYAVSELSHIQQVTGRGYIGGLVETPFVEIINGTNIGKFDINGYWVPWYSIHKIYKGLIDAYELAENSEALNVVVDFADWAVSILNQMSDEQVQAMLECEHGGMNHIFAKLYSFTGNSTYLDTAVRFSHKAIVEPLEQGVDDLQGKHANTQIPKIIGIAGIYNQEHAYEKYKTAAQFFWNTVVNRRSYVIGGNSLKEHFEAIDMESLGIKTAESCNTHNMLLLTKLLFSWNHDSAYMDYYENALFNHILGTQDCHTGNKTYFTSLLPGHYRIYSTKDTAWWCCTGTGMENPGKYAEAIYFQEQDNLYVNLFISSQFDWEAKGLTIRQESNLPYSDTVILKIIEGKAEANINIRVPSWMTSELVAVVNGKDRFVQREKGYLTISGAWEKGDEIRITFPMAVSKYTSKDNAGKIAFTYGPVVLAGKFGNMGLPNDTIEDEVALDTTTASVPDIFTEDEDISNWITMEDAETLTFKISAEVTTDKNEVTLVPFYQIHHEFYSVYWNLNTVGDKFEKLLSDITIDSIEPDGQQDEIGHSMKCNCLKAKHYGSFKDINGNMSMWRDAYGVEEAYFSYEMSVDGERQNFICAKYFSEDNKFKDDGITYSRDFDIMVDGNVVAEQTIEISDKEKYYRFYEIPKELTLNKSKVKVMFKAKSVYSCVGKVLQIRITRGKIDQ